MSASEGDRELYVREALRRAIISAPDPRQSGLLHDAVAILVKIATEFGFDELSSADGPSACKLVSEEIGLSEQEVVRLWNEQKTLVCRT